MIVVFLSARNITPNLPLYVSIIEFLCAHTSKDLRWGEKVKSALKNFATQIVLTVQHDEKLT